MLQIALCDDEENALKVIRFSIEKGFKEKGIDVQITSWQNATDLRNTIFSGTKYDMVFLDISMPDMNGIVLAQQLKDHDPDLMILFLSSREEAVFETFRVSPFRFIRKRTFRSELSQIIDDILKERNAQPARRLLIQGKSGDLSINPLDIVYLEAQNKNCALHFVSETITVPVTFSQLQAQVQDDGFIQIHRSILVNYRFIRLIRGNEILLDNGESLPVSKYRLTQVKKEFQRLLQGMQ